MQGDYVAAVATLVGVIVGFGLTVVKDLFTERKQLAASRKQFARALLSEARTLRDRYVEVFGSPIERWQVNQPLELGGYVRSTNVISVYDGNTDKLGLFDSRDAEAIVKAYTLAKSLVEAIPVAMEIVRDYQRQIVPLRVMENPLWHGFAEQLRGYVNEVGPRFQNESRNALAAGADAISVLERYAGD